LCFECAQQCGTEKCPVCRKPVDQVIRIYSVTS
jgi:hypothetical protein